MQRQPELKRLGSQKQISKTVVPMAGSNMKSPDIRKLEGSIESKEQMSGGSAEISLKYS
jgi:hypothetical protein